MTVAELIQALQAMPQDAVVVLEDDSFARAPDGVSLVRLVSDWELTPMYAALRDDGSVIGVKIA